MACASPPTVGPDEIAGGALRGASPDDAGGGSGGYAGYPRRMSTLAFLEEIQLEADVASYTRVGAELISVPQGRSGGSGDSASFVLDVPGLAESRPSLLRGDAVLVRPLDPVTGAPSGRTYYEGIIHEVRLSEVLLKFDSKFQSSLHVAGRGYDVSYKLNRLTLRRQHEALTPRLLPSDQVLFPEPLPPLAPQMMRGGELALPAAGPFGFAPLGKVSGSLNAEQRAAVRSICLNASVGRPFILFGPPGTGKTTTL